MPDRQRAWEARQTERGLTKVCVYVPTERAEELKQIAAAMREQREKE